VVRIVNSTALDNFIHFLIALTIFLKSLLLYSTKQAYHLADPDQKWSKLFRTKVNKVLV